MQLPGPLRAVVGLVVSVVEEARHLPDRAIELPMLAVSTALQASLRAQQRYAGLAAKGDEVLNRRTPTEEPPAWATFDEPLPVEQLRRTAMQQPGGADPNAGQLLDELFGAEDAASFPDAEASVSPRAPEQAVLEAPVKKAPAKKVPAAKATSKKLPAEKVPAKKAAARKTSVPKKAAISTKSAPAKRAAGSEAAANGGAGSAKRVSKPRHTAPSAFDNVDD